MSSSNAQNHKKTTLVNIKLYATGLKNVAGAFKGISDPYAVVTVLASNAHEKPHVLGKTEVIKNSLKPDWITQFATEYTFGKETRINIGIFDEVRKTGKHKTMGSSQFELGEVLGSHGNVKAKHLKHGGTIFCRVTTAAEEDYGTFKLKLRGTGLKKGKVDPFFVLNAQAAHTGGNRVWHQEYRSEVIRDNAEPEWKPLEISMERLCGGDCDRAIQVEAYSWDKGGKHKILGKFQTSVNGLLTALAVPERGMEGMQLVHKSKPHGKLFVVHAEVVGGSVVPPSPPAGYTASAPPTAIMPLAPPPLTNGAYGMASSLPETNTSLEPLPTPLPPPMAPSLSSYPISASDSASSLPPAMPPPAFDVADEPRFSSSVTATSVSHVAETFELMPSPSAPSPKRAPSQRRPQFTDYLAGGLEISLSIAIDFTGSNGDPRVPGTLHHISRDGQLNDYEKVLTAVGRVLARYDADQKFPVYGFGAKYNGNIKHCFQVGGAPELIGMKGILEGYRSVFSTGLTMSGPTVFAEVIQHVAIQAQKEYERKQAMGKQSYSILLILTDGAVTDEEQTKIALKYANSAPLSIVIVGLGNEDFSKMQFLDRVHQSDDNMRDIVKFVEFNKFRNDRQSLSEESLARIPSQVVNFFYDSKGIRPLPATAASSSNVAAEAYNAEEDVELDFNFGSDGAIQLADSRKATWNGSTWGDTSTFMAALPQGNLFNSLSLSPGREKPKLTPYVSAPNNTRAMPQAPTDDTLVHVKVPPNAQPGMQLRVTNPKTGKSKVVAVPMGVPPGGTFPCRV